MCLDAVYGPIIDSAAGFQRISVVHAHTRAAAFKTMARADFLA